MPLDEAASGGSVRRAQATTKASAPATMAGKDA